MSRRRGSRLARALLVALAIGVVFAASAHACPTCFAGGSDGQRSSYLYTTALLMGLPLGLASVLAFAFWRATVAASRSHEPPGPPAT